jgi:uncharacterized membrane protein
MEKTTSGLDETIASALTYVLGFITGIIFFLTEKENKTVRFHAMQSDLVFGAVFVVQIALMFVSFIIPFIGILSLVTDLPSYARSLACSYHQSIPGREIQAPCCRRYG